MDHVKRWSSGSDPVLGREQCAKSSRRNFVSRDLRRLKCVQLTAEHGKGYFVRKKKFFLKECKKIQEISKDSMRFQDISGNFKKVLEDSRDLRKNILNRFLGNSRDFRRFQKTSKDFKTFREISKEI